MRASRVVDHVERLRDRYPEAPLVLFVPRVQIGRSIGEALARRRGGWVGLRALIPRHHAAEVARLEIIRQGRQEAPVAGQLFRAARIAQALPDAARGDTLPGWHRLADTVARSIETLRADDVPVADVTARAEADGASDTMAVIAGCYERYVQELDEKGLYDDAAVYRWATERLRTGPVPGPIPETVYGVVSAVDLSERAAQFLRGVQRRGRAFVRLGAADRSAPPPQTAAARFRSVSLPEEGAGDDSESDPSEDPGDRPAAPDRFVRAVGARGEVRAVLRDLLETETAFDDATIAYADSRPYATLLADEAERLGIPLTMGTGLPAEHTRTGRALRDLYGWVRDDYDPALLVRMLREGLLRTDRWRRQRPDRAGDPDQHPSFRPHEAATLLAARSYEAGRDGLQAGLASALQALEAERDERSLTGREEVRRARLRLLNAYVRDLVALIPEQGTVQAVAQASCAFLERFGPTDAPDRPEEERTPDEAARGLLYQRLHRLTTLDVSCEAPGPQLAALFQQWLRGQYVQAESPRPGHVHVLPLESAGYSDRAHLHVVGLDSTTFAAPAPDTGMLQESDRRALVASLEEKEDDASRQTPADEMLWRAARALRRHRGRTCLYTRIYDVEAGEERDPSALFLRAERAASGQDDAPPSPTEDPVGLVPAPDALALSDAECWLQVRPREQSGREEGPEADREEGAARRLLRDRHPWVRAGEAARQARQSATYTVHDGLLPAARYPELDLFENDGRPLSASRLETLAEAPYIYFLKYVLDVRPHDEPALDDEPWFNRLRKGALLHRVYEQFLRAVDGPVTEDDAALLETVVDEVLAEETRAFAPPSPVVEAAARRELLRHARLFLRVELHRDEASAPELFEWGFGFPSHRREPQDADRPAALSVGDRALRLRGRIDRVDRHRATGALTAWDYKTGSASSYDEDEPLQDGKTLQWALYAYALEALRGETVEASGYFFATAKEMGSRIAADPRRHRAEVERILERLGALAETGSFPVTPDLADVGAWSWGGYDRIVGDLPDRRRELRDKDYPDDRPVPPTF